jgi:hypothetical protein
LVVDRPSVNPALRVVTTFLPVVVNRSGRAANPCGFAPALGTVARIEVAFCKLSDDRHVVRVQRDDGTSDSVEVDREGWPSTCAGVARP